jgi:formylglycine-generating enzyme required for sulfatase activity
MEDYVATDRRPVEKCLADVAGADIYVGLFAFRYGYVPPAEHGNPDGLSITELEFLHAEKLRKPCLAFAVSEDAPWPPKFIDGLKGERINRLREYLLTEKTASFFSSPHQLASLVQAAVTKQLEESRKSKTGTVNRASSLAITWDIEKNGSPYPGLMHFKREYAPVFFGREAEISEILDRICLPEGRFAIVSGGSGTGKSSLVDAGILPRLEQTGLPGAGTCLCVRIVPSQGDHPFDALTRVLHSQVEQVGFKAYDLGKELLAQPAIFPERIQTIIAKGMNNRAFVLFLDQMEELFTAQAKDHAKPFLSALYSAVNEASLRVIATIRSDFLHHCHEHPEMVKVLNGRGHYALGPVERFMMHDIIVKPANCAGLKVSDNLARHIVNDTGSESANLPLLAFVLNQLFEKRSDHELSEQVYKDLGGVGGAIAEHVKTVEEQMRQELGGKAVEFLPQIFRSLVLVNAEGLPTRRRPLLSGFSEPQRRVVKLLTDGRLLHTEGEGEASTVSISHEKLFEAWLALRDYISVNKKSLMDQTLLENRARKWIDMGKPWFGGLASGRELRDFRRTGVPTPQAKSYLSASNRAWWMKAVTGLALALVFGFIARAWQHGVSVEHTLLKLKSTFTRIHIEPEMVEVKAGDFRMGNVGRFGEPSERPAHDVKIQKPFKLAKYEVTFDEYDRFALTTGRYLPGDQGRGRGRRPVINVSWEDARDFANWLSKQTGKRYRLPSEAEWEYAAGSGSISREVPAQVSSFRLSDYAWHAENSKSQAQPVGTKKPNGLGLYDMRGNVWEWVEDCWHENYNGAPLDGRAWKEENGGQCVRRVLRGGSWVSDPEILRSSLRGSASAVNRYGDTGFRLAQDIP